MDKEKLYLHIKSLQLKHCKLEEVITELDCHYDEYQHCEELKKQRLKLRDEISQCETRLNSL